MGTLFIISAPSGTGKTSLVSELAKLDQSIQVSISHTTRPKRAQEKEGVNYHFVDRAAFDAMVQSGHFLEFAEVFGHLYGTSQLWVDQQHREGKDVILEIDWQGAQQVAGIMSCVRIFILPPSRKILEERLNLRAQDDKQTMAKRLACASDEVSHYGEYDYLVVNEDFQGAIQELRAIILSQRLLTSKRSVTLMPLLKDLLG